MSAHPNLPTLFGRFTVVLRDHGKLRKNLDRLLELCRALEAGSALPDDLVPAQVMRDLKHELSAHFAAEESESYFGVVEAEEPALSTRVSALRQEHLQMLVTAAALGEFAADPRALPHLAAPVRTLISQFERHERAESGMLNRLFRPRRVSPR